MLPRHYAKHQPFLFIPSILCLVANQSSTDAPPVNISISSLISTYAKRPLPSIHLKVVHTHWLKLFNFQLFRIVSFYISFHYAPYFLQTLHNICIISRLKSPQTLINTELTYQAISSSGIFLIAKLTLVYSCKPLENGLSRILYTWILLDVFLTFVRPKDVIRLKIRLFILCMYCCVKHNNT